MTTGSNTQILIKRSTSSANPGTLKSGELAYSYQSDTLFIGTQGSDGYLEIGGQSLTNKVNSAYDQANSATSLAQSAFDKANTDNSLGQYAYNQANAATTSAQAAYGQANAATSSASAAYGQANAATNSASASYNQANAATSSASAAYNQANAATSSASSAYNQANAATSSASAAYGQANAATSSASAAYERANASYQQANAATSSASAAYGQANAATNSASAAYGQANAAYAQANAATNSAQAAYDKANNIVTSFTIADTSGHSNVISSGTQLNIVANTGVTTYVGTNESIYIGVDYANVIGANGAGSNYQTIDGTINITGDLHVTGNISYTDTATVVAQNSLIFLANNNTTSDVVDIGFVGQAFNGINEIYSGLFRHAGDTGKDYYLFDNYTHNPADTFTINPFTNGFTTSNLHAELIGNVTASLVKSNGFLAAEGTTFNGHNGYSFKGDGAYDTGMFSSSDGHLQFYNNAVETFETTTDLFTHHTNVALANSGFISNPSLSSGDGGTNSTLQLKPDTNLTSDQYIVIDPTSPNHIHLRAGGTIDASSADLYLGGEQTHVVVSDTAQNVVVKTDNAHSFTFTSDGKFELPNGTKISDDGSSNLYIETLQQATAANITFYDPATGKLTYGALDAVVNNSSLANNAHTWYVDTSGNLIAPVVSGGGKVIAGEGTGTSGGYTFDETGNDTGMFSPSDGQLDFYSNNNLIYSANGAGLFVKQGGLTLSNGASVSDVYNSTLIGLGVDTNNSNTERVSIGNYAGESSQGYAAVAVGYEAGNLSQSSFAVAVGLNAGQTSQGTAAVAVGHAAGQTSQGQDAVAVGVAAGNANQGNYAVAIGKQSAHGSVSGQGDYAIAIGYKAAYSSQVTNSIILNASGNELNASDSGLYINPVRYTATQDDTYDGLMFYNSSTNEVRYSYTLDGGSF